MTIPTTPVLSPPDAPVVSINDNLPTSSPSARSTLIGLACILGVVTLFVLYWNIIGF